MFFYLTCTNSWSFHWRRISKDTRWPIVPRNNWRMHHLGIMESKTLSFDIVCMLSRKRISVMDQSYRFRWPNVGVVSWELLPSKYSITVLQNCADKSMPKLLKKLHVHNQSFRNYYWYELYYVWNIYCTNTYHGVHHVMWRLNISAKKAKKQNQKEWRNKKRENRASK